MSKFQNVSKYDKYSSIKEIYPHRHCPVCNKMIKVTEDYCSGECGTISKKKEKGNKKKIFLFVGIYIVVIIMLFAFLL